MILVKELGTQQQPRHLARCRRFDRTGAQPGTRFHADVPAILGDPVSRLRAMLSGQGIERPIRIGDHPNRAFMIYQDRPLRTGEAALRGGLGCLQNFIRLIGETAHAYRIADSRPNSSQICEAAFRLQATL